MGTKWITADVITFARMNQKTLIVQAAEPAIMYQGQPWLDVDDDILYQRDAANAAWDTIIKEELAATITGLHTFDRGAAVPFAVDAASLKVTNLDADFLDGLDSGTGDGTVLVLPVAVEGQILKRGAGNWEVSDMKHVEIVEFSAIEAGEDIDNHYMWRVVAGATDARIGTSEVVSVTNATAPNFWTAPKACTVKSLSAKVTTPPNVGAVVFTVQRESVVAALTLISTLTVPIASYVDTDNPDAALAQGESLMVKVLGNAGNNSSEAIVTALVEFDV